MKLLHKQFYRALTWNSIESICYHSALLFHQGMLFRVIGSGRYGFIGSLFSFIYLSIALANFGLDDAIAPFFYLSTASKSHFKKMLIPQIIPEFIILAVLALTISFVGPSALSSFNIHDIPPSLLWIISGIIVSEGIKKTCRSLLHVAFANKATTIVELLSLAAYLLIIWGGHYGYSIPLTPGFVLAPLLVTSWVSTCILAHAVYRFYRALPEHAPAVITSTIPWRVVRSRFFSYLTHLNHQFFSGNVLVPLFAVRFGLSQAGVLKLTSHSVHTISGILHKIFGPTSFALLAHSKDMDPVEQQEAFSLATGYVYQTLLALIVFMSINYRVLISLSSGVGVAGYWPLIALFVIIHFSEHLFIVYEKWYITQEKIHYLFLLNSITTLLVYVTLWWLSNIGSLTVLAMILAIRLTSFAVLNALSFRLWNITPRVTTSTFYLFMVLIVSLVARMIL